MITAGIDIGALTTKAVLLKDDTILSHAIVPTGLEADAAVASRAMNKALESANIPFEDIEGISFISSDRDSVLFTGSKRVAKVLALARGAKWICSTVRTVIDIGAENAFVLRLDEKAKVVDFATNDRCAAGSGAFLKKVAEMLEVPLEKIGEISLTSNKPKHITSTCVVFAESEVITSVHQAVPTNNILAGIHESMVNRIFGMMNRVGTHSDVVMTGGVAKNIAVVKMLEEKADLNIIAPDEAQIAGALGAALIAREKAGAEAAGAEQPKVDRA